MATPRVILCDNHLLILDKPAGMATQPDLVDWGKEWLKEKFQKPFGVFLEPIHRLDKPVRGLVILARTSKALSRLNESMRARLILKKYEARVDRPMQHKEGRLVHRLRHDEYKAVVDPLGKEAVLYYREIAPSLVEIDLETGRYHQIRAQLAAAGSPICGDEKYGGSVQQGEGIALVHKEVRFPHPITEQQVVCKI